MPTESALPVACGAGSGIRPVGAPRAALRQQGSRLVALEVPEEDVEFVSEQQKTQMRQRIAEAERHLEALQAEFEAKGYTKAATYLHRARDQLFNHLRLWLATGILAPRTTSIIESLTRELVRRLKKIGWNWSDEGATRMGRLVMIRRYDAQAWYEYWNQRINLRGRCQITLQSCRLQPAA